MALVVLTGGARSGKSALAIEAARASGLEVWYVATGEALDDEMAQRIALHRSERPDSWRTIEEPLELSSALKRPEDAAFVIVDCLTLWVSNCMGIQMSDEDISRHAKSAAGVASERTGSTIVVTNEVGSGIVPTAFETRRYRDLLGRVNSIWTDAADRAFLTVAGKAIPLSDPVDLLGPFGG